jgi:hypothetical protein
MQVKPAEKAQQPFEWSVTVEPRRTNQGQEALSSKGSSSSGSSQRCNNCRANAIQR